jgi:hypothetical protein
MATNKKLAPQWKFVVEWLQPTTYNYNLQVTNNDSSNEILKAIKTYVDEKNNVKHLSWQMEQIDGWWWRNFPNLTIQVVQPW